MPNAGRHVNAVYDHVGGTQQMRQGLLLYALDAGLKLRLLRWRLHILLANVLNGAGQKAASAASRVEDRFPEARIEHVNRKLSYRPRRVVFAGVPGTLEIFEQLLVDAPEQVPIRGIVEVNVGLDLVDHLPQQDAGLHVLVGVLKDAAHQAAAGHPRILSLNRRSEPPCP